MNIFSVLIPLLILIIVGTYLYLLYKVRSDDWRRLSPKKTTGSQHTQVHSAHQMQDPGPASSLESGQLASSAASSAPQQTSQTLIPFQVDPNALRFIEEGSNGPEFGTPSGEGLYGYEEKEGNVAIEAQFERAGRFSEGLAVVQVEGKCGYIDQTGEFVIPPKFDPPIAYEDMNFIDGLAAARLDGRYGYINKSGDFVVEPQFVRASQFEHGLGLVQNEEGFLAFDLDGQLAVEGPFSTTRSLYKIQVNDEVSEISKSIEIDGVSLQATLTKDVEPSGEQSEAGEWPDELDPKMPIRMELSNGVRCVFDLSEGIEIDGEQVKYTCSDGSKVLGDPLQFTLYQAPRVTDRGEWIVRNVVVEKSGDAYTVVDAKLMGVQTIWVQWSEWITNHTYVFIPNEPVVRRAPLLR